MSWLFSRALVAEFSAENFSAGEQSAPSNLTPTPQAYWSPGKTTDTCPRFRSGMTCEHLTVERGEAVLTSFREAFPARIFRRQAKAQESTGSEAVCGESSRESLAKYDQLSRSWKTRQFSLAEVLEEFSETWPNWGMTLHGVSYRLPPPDWIIAADDSGSLLPTPCAQDWQPICWSRAEKIALRGNDRQKGARGGCANLQDSLAAAWLILGKRSERPLRGERPYANPCYWESIMDWPIGWTDCEPLATDKFQQWRHSHGEFCIDD